MKESTSFRRRVATGVGVSAVAALGLALLSASPAQAEGNVLGANAEGAISGEFLIKLADGVSTEDASSLLGGRYDATITNTFDSFGGFAATMDDTQARRLAADPRVAFVEQDRQVWSLGEQASPPSWGLDRVDQNALPLDDSYTSPNEGTGVTAYIIDTGVALDHPDFGGRATSGIDAVDNDDDATDCNGHGTHVAGTIGGTEYGLAKDVALVGVRVLDCAGSGTTEGVVAGIDWVTENHSGPSVANMSLGGGADETLDAAVAASVESGVTYAVAAGNSADDACGYSPARVESAITVGATNNTDAKADFSSYGSCVDIFAPGEDITSAWLDGGENTISGTSMATPHVAGAAALYLAANTSATPADVAAALTENATPDVVTDPGTGSPNLLLYVGFIAGA
ncbi:MAG TPA: S8 family peptidase [Phytomonospora sp.]